MGKDTSKLSKKRITDKTGKQTFVWVKQGEDPKAEKKTTQPTSEDTTKESDDTKEGEKTINAADEKIQAVSMKLEELAKLSQEAKKQGKSAPNFNLCQVTVPGTNLFCSDNKGVERAKMPQLKGVAVEGSKAGKIAKESGESEVDGESLFKKHLVDKGVKMTKKEVPAQFLKATQTELVGAKVAGMTEALKENPHHEGIGAPIFVSKEGYILDGHHRWAAHVGLRMSKENKGEPVTMSTIVVDMSIEDLLKETNDWADDFGIAQKAGKVEEKKKIKKAFDELMDESCDHC